ncbi:transcriptional regulator [Vibrio parahaemolyticus]|nr:transcriptional regulator [Vibrio parahaemolyticus]EJB0387216.1 transcriptional regulator [Vibrio parahaemolyticus]EJG1101702.1 transcriptional regulator [Vibrio parahaemolyticus]ELA6664028.1 transcriptional regulator [Vibrio parahaemolyticus]
MKARIGIADEELVRKHMLDVSAGKLNHVENFPHLWFTSLTELAQVLTNENIKLLYMISRDRENSARKLAEITDRNVEDLEVSIEILISKGFARIEICGNEERLTAIYTSFEIVMGKELEDLLQ